jgi:hypothetical protein
LLRRAHVECAASGGRWPLPQTGPGAAGRQRGCSRVRSGLARKPAPLFAVPHSSGRAGPCLRRAGDWPDMVASAPRLDLGPGLPATACRKCRTATSHDEPPRFALLYRTRTSGLHAQEQGVRTCQMCPALFQVVSKKRRKLRCPFLDNVPETKQGRRTAQQRRCGEPARTFPVAFCRKLRRARPV